MQITLDCPTKIAQFTTIFRWLRNIIREINISFRPDGLYAQGMDPCHACLFELDLKSSWFSTYLVPHELIVGVYCEALFKVTSCLEPNQSIRISEDQDRLCIDLSGEGTVGKLFKIHMLDLNCAMLEIPTTIYAADALLVSEELSNLATQLSIFGEDVAISFSEEGIVLTSEGDTGTMCATIEDNIITEYAVEENNTITSNFSLQFIRNVCAFSKLNKNIQLNCSQDLPLRVEYALGDKGSALRFFLAPKIQDM